MKPETDLHLHSYYSDGAEGPDEIVRRAKELGYKTLALTDHDGVTGLPEFRKACEKAGINGINGIEFSAYYSMPNPFNPTGASRRYYMHILGYGFDPADKKLRKALEKIMDQRAERNEKMRLWFCKNGVPITNEELRKYSPSDYIGKMSFARLLVDRGLCEDIASAVKDRRYLANPAIRAIHRDKIEAGKAIELIHGAGGAAFLAHPYQISYDGYGLDSQSTFNTNREMVISALAAEGLDGIECFYSDHTPAQSAQALELAGYLNVLVSRGSDDHGAGMRPVKVMSEFASEPEPGLLDWVSDIQTRKGNKR